MTAIPPSHDVRKKRQVRIREASKIACLFIYEFLTFTNCEAA
jgi:hypothetical protein